MGADDSQSHCRCHCWCRRRCRGSRRRRKDWRSENRCRNDGRREISFRSDRRGERLLPLDSGRRECRWWVNYVLPGRWLCRRTGGTGYFAALWANTVDSVVSLAAVCAEKREAARWRRKLIRRSSYLAGPVLSGFFGSDLGRLSRSPTGRCRLISGCRPVSGCRLVDRPRLGRRLGAQGSGVGWIVVRPDVAIAHELGGQASTRKEAFLVGPERVGLPTG